MKQCGRCGFEQTWSGDGISCPFGSKNDFGKNWNCGLIGKIRDLCEKGMNGEDHRLQYQYCDDMKYCNINISEIGMEDDEDTFIGMCLYVEWYKSRGATDAMWILSGDDLPRVPTFQDLQRIVDYYAKTGN